MKTENELFQAAHGTIHHRPCRTSSTLEPLVAEPLALQSPYTAGHTQLARGVTPEKKDKTTPFNKNLTSSQLIYQAACNMHTSLVRHNLATNNNIVSATSKACSSIAKARSKVHCQHVRKLISCNVNHASSFSCTWSNIGSTNQK